MQANLVHSSGFPVLQRRRTMESNRFNPVFSNPNPPSGVVEIYSSNQWKSCFDASRNDNKLLVVQFTAPWCGPCRHMEPIMKEFAAKYKDVQFVKIDVDQFQYVARQFNVGTMLPAVVIVKKAKQIDVVTGVKKNELQNKIEKHRM